MSQQQRFCFSAVSHASLFFRALAQSLCGSPVWSSHDFSLHQEHRLGWVALDPVRQSPAVAWEASQVLGIKQAPFS